jgi:hypothetical protein
MSAWLVERAHIAYLIDAAWSLGLRHGGCYYFHDRSTHKLDDLTASAVGQTLWATCAASVNHRYSHHPERAEVVYGEHRYHPQHVDPVQFLKSIACYEYQSCERDDWEASEAKALCESMRSLAISSLPGYDAAEWGAPKRRGPAIVRSGEVLR